MSMAAAAKRRYAPSNFWRNSWGYLRSSSVRVSSTRTGLSWRYSGSLKSCGEVHPSIASACHLSCGHDEQNRQFRVAPTSSKLRSIVGQRHHRCSFGLAQGMMAGRTVIEPNQAEHLRHVLHVFPHSLYLIEPWRRQQAVGYDVGQQTAAYIPALPQVGIYLVSHCLAHDHPLVPLHRLLVHVWSFRIRPCAH